MINRPGGLADEWTSKPKHEGGVSFGAQKHVLVCS